MIALTSKPDFFYVEILIGSCHYFSDNYIELLLLLFFCMTLICKICTVNLTNLVSVKFQITNLITHFGVQLADAKDVLQGIRHVPDVRFPVLTPNLRVCPVLFYFFWELYHIALYQQ